jgi:c-di-GMP-binding flagellar brake protein YcgR
VAASSPIPDPKWRIARSFPRFATDLVTRVHVQFAPADREPLLGRMVDIGLGGACVLVAEGTLGPRQKVLLEFRFPMSLQPLKLKATVRHCHHQNHYGFQFMDLQGEEREKIRRVCATLKIV